MIGHLEAVQLLLEHGANKELECTRIWGDDSKHAPREVVCLKFESETDSEYAERSKNKAAITALLR